MPWPPLTSETFLQNYLYRTRRARCLSQGKAIASCPWPFQSQTPSTQLHGRLCIREFVTGATNPNSGKPRILVIVDAPGERLQTPIAKQGHRGTRYTDGEDWPA